MLQKTLKIINSAGVAYFSKKNNCTYAIIRNTRVTFSTNTSNYTSSSLAAPSGPSHGVLAKIPWSCSGSNKITMDEDKLLLLEVK